MFTLASCVEIGSRPESEKGQVRKYPKAQDYILRGAGMHGIIGPLYYAIAVSALAHPFTQVTKSLVKLLKAQMAAAHSYTLYINM